MHAGVIFQPGARACKTIRPASPKAAPSPGENYPVMLPSIRFVRLPVIPRKAILAQMTDPRVLRHLPLMTHVWTDQDVIDFVAAKEARWARDGLGHWAVIRGDEYVGWGGFEREGEDWDFGLVLRTEHFGLGMAITRKALDFARRDPRIPYVTFLLAQSRRHLGGLARLGAVPAGEVQIGSATFRRFRIETKP